jgi:hypothetical protein
MAVETVIQIDIYIDIACNLPLKLKIVIEIVVEIANLIVIFNLFVSVNYFFDQSVSDNVFVI